MRISSTLFFQTGLNAINAQQSDLLHLYQQAASGKRMVTPADDPLAAAQAVNIRQSQSLNERYADNREVLKKNLGIEENTLSSVTNLMQDIKTRLVEAGNGTMSDADRATLAGVLSNAKDTLYGFANATDGNGQHLFSGFTATQAPFTKNDDGVVSYVGHTGPQQREIQADQSRKIATGDLGSDVFASASASSRVYVTQADTDNAGTGVIGAPTIIDPQGTSVGQDFTITFDGATAPGQYVVSTQGWDNDVDPPVLNNVTQTYPFAESATSLELPGGVRVALSGQPQDGDTFTVSFAAQASTTELDIFGTLDSIIAALEQPTAGSPVNQSKLANALATAMQKIDVNYDQVLTVRASVGSRLNEIDAIDASGSARGLSYANQVSKLEDVDYYTVTTQLQLRTAALEAAALAFKQIQGTSLFNMGSR